MVGLLEKLQGYVHNGPAGNDLMQQQPPMNWWEKLGAAGEGANQFSGGIFGSFAPWLGIASAYQGYRSMQGDMINIDQLESDLKPWKDKIEAQGTRADSLMDLTSDYNQLLKRNMYTDNADQVANLMNLTNRNMPGSYSGITNQIATDKAFDANVASTDQFNKQYLENYKIGANLENTNLQHTESYYSDIANAKIENERTKRMAEAALWGSMSTGLFDYVSPLGQV
jgi:hypothetical protein